jgi:hypothetical protein
MSAQSDTLPLVEGLRWWRILAGGLLIELGLMVVSVASYAMGRMDDLEAVVPPLTLPIAFLAGWWVARRAARPIVNAALAGAIAIPLYVALVVFAMVAAPPEAADTSTMLSPAYLATHVIKILGAAAGGWLVARRRG